MLKNQLFNIIEEQRAALCKMADEIFDNPEYEGEEVFAAELITNFLTENGFNVVLNIADLKTAFKAVFKQGEGGPNIGILCEYDALKGMGHACGHHMQGPACIGAAIAVKKLLKEENYTLTVYGTPAEETFGGKCDMIKHGFFEELDVALMMHGGPNTCTDVRCLAAASYSVEFLGKGSHAALAPEKGKSAFDALLVAFNGIEFLREHVPDDVRMHYTVTELPGPANIVPKSAKGEFSLRSFSKKTLDEIIPRLHDIVKGASLIAGVDYTIQQNNFLYNKIPVLKLNDVMMENAKLANAPQMAPPREKTGSTDFGNVMYNIPGCCIRVAFVPEGTPSHSQEFINAGKTQAAHDCVIYAAKIIAGTSLDLIKDPQKVLDIKQEFIENKKSFN